MDPSAISAARGAIASRYDAGYLPDKPRVYQTKAKNAQEAHEAIRPTDFGKDKAGSGDHAKLYDLIYKRALASQMASARMERTTVDMLDGTGQIGLRATGQVVKFPGFLALYEEGIDDKDDENGALLPVLEKGDVPAKNQSRRCSTLPNRRRAIQRRALSKGWRNWVLVVRQPTLRSFRSSRIVLMYEWKKSFLCRGIWPPFNSISRKVLRSLCRL